MHNLYPNIKQPKRAENNLLSGFVFKKKLIAHAKSYSLSFLMEVPDLPTLSSYYLKILFVMVLSIDIWSFVDE